MKSKIINLSITLVVLAICGCGPDKVAVNYEGNEFKMLEQKVEVIFPHYVIVSTKLQCLKKNPATLIAEGYDSKGTVCAMKEIDPGSWNPGDTKWFEFNVGSHAGLKIARITIRPRL